MKIAVASERELVTEHFGHCKNFNIYEVERNNIIKEISIPNPGHKPGFLPNFLNDLGINVIISGGMGAGAINIFNNKNIEVITGACGNARKLVESYIDGELVSTDSICNQHIHHEECSE